MINVDSLAGGIPYEERDDTVALFTLNELADNVRPVDKTANLEGLAGDTGSAPPLAIATVDVGLTGRGKLFGADIGLQGVEAVSDSTQVLRSCTLRAILTYEILNHSDTDVGTVLARGEGGSDAERILYALELERVNSSTLRLRAKWQELDGTNATIAGVTFTAPQSGDFIYVAWVRRWQNTTSVIVDYYVNGELIGSETVTEGDIGNGSGGKFMVGCQGDGAGNYQDFLPAGTIVDCLSVESDEMANEEIRQDFRRIFIHQPSGRTLLRSYLPPGRTYSKIINGVTQRWFSAMGSILGYTIARAEQLRDDFLPDANYGEALVRWEGLYRIQPKQGDLLAQRRSKLLSRVKNILGYQRDDIKLQLEDVLGLDSSDIEIAEFSGVRCDDFDVDDLADGSSRIWQTEIGAGIWSIADGELRLTALPSLDLRRFGIGLSPFREISMGQTLSGNTVDSVIVCKIVIFLPSTQEAIQGIYYRTSQGDLFVVGLRDDGAPNPELVSFNFDGGSATFSSVTVLESAGLTGDLWIRVANTALGSFTTYWSTTSADGPWTATTAQTGQLPDHPTYCGLTAIQPNDTDDSSDDVVDVDFDDFSILEPRSPRGHGWIVVRDPDLDGSFDLLAGEEQIIKQGPAHQKGTVNDSYQGFALGDTGRGRLGRDPLFPSFKEFPRDNAIILPRSGAEWAALGFSKPSSLYRLDETAGNLVDSRGAQDLTATTSPAILYDQDSPDFDRNGIGFDEQANQNAEDTTGVYDITATDSMYLFIIARIGTPSSNRELYRAAPSNDMRVQIRTNGTPRLYFDGAFTAGVADHRSDTVSHPFLMALNRADTSINLFTDLEQVTGVHTVTALALAEWGIGGRTNFSFLGEILYMALWFNPAISMNANLLRRIGYTLPYV